MAKENPNIEPARVDYENNMKTKDMAEKYGVKERTIQRWAKEKGWSRENDETLKINSPTKNEAPKNIVKTKKIITEPTTRSNKLNDEILLIKDEISKLKLENEKQSNDYAKLENEYMLLSSETASQVYRLKDEIISSFYSAVRAWDNETIVGIMKDIHKSELAASELQGRIDIYSRIINEESKMNNEISASLNEILSEIRENRNQRILFGAKGRKSPVSKNSEIIERIMKMKESGYRQEDIAKEIGISSGSVSKIINNNR